MDHFQPTFGVKDTAHNIKSFINTHTQIIWDLFKPLAPYIIGLLLLDAVITDLFFAQSKGKFQLGEVLASYFWTCFVISWHRVVIHGPENYVLVNPFSPKRHELVFLGMGIATVLALIVASSSVMALALFMKNPIASLLGVVTVLILAYCLMRVCFYYPSKAVNSNLTLMQAFHMSRGYIWRIMCASFLGSFKVILMFVGAIFVLAILFSGVLYGLTSVLGPFPANTIGFLFLSPAIFYFSPFLYAYGVTSLSNYYLYVLQNDPEAVAFYTSKEGGLLSQDEIKDKKERSALEAKIDDEQIF